ncbi:extracellular solute-binding protein [Niameybacter massiliensis]|uniref:extracellular solute-binding protein n=1 Tax=Niameybacter massiliensis TaxID=1658108 RepID=UPI0006B5FCAC|nr:extracellular solute-binding protein [Niameybacter massiliensis]
MKLRKLMSIVGILAISGSVLVGCSTGSSSAGAKEDDKTVTIWASGSDNVRVQFEKQIEQFNKSNEEGYVAELQFITAGTGAQGIVDRIAAAKKAGQTNTDYDLVELGGDEVMRYLELCGEDVFVELDQSKIPNMENLQIPATFREDLVLPYRGTTVVLAYNSETVPNPPTTAEELYQWIKDNPGRFAYNTPSSGGAGSSFVTTAVYNFLEEEALTSTDEKYVAQWEQGFNLLTELHPYLYKSSGKVVYPNKNQGTLDLLANKEVDIIPAWADMAITQYREGVLPSTIKIAQIEPSFTGSTVALGIPSIGSNTEGAYAFMNYMISPEAQNIALDAMAAIPVIDFELLDENLTSIISELKIDEFRIKSIGGLGDQLNEKWDVEIGTLQ